MGIQVSVLTYLFRWILPPMDNFLKMEQEISFMVCACFFKEKTILLYPPNARKRSCMRNEGGKPVLPRAKLGSTAKQHSTVLLSTSSKALCSVCLYVWILLLLLSLTKKHRSPCVKLRTKSLPLSQLSRHVQTVHILRCDCFFLHCIWCLAYNQFPPWYIRFLFGEDQTIIS